MAAYQATIGKNDRSSTTCKAIALRQGYRYLTGLSLFDKAIAHRSLPKMYLWRELLDGTKWAVVRGPSIMAVVPVKVVDASIKILGAPVA